MTTTPATDPGPPVLAIGRAPLTARELAALDLTTIPPLAARCIRAAFVSTIRPGGLGLDDAKFRRTGKLTRAERTKWCRWLWLRGAFPWHFRMPCPAPSETPPYVRRAHRWPAEVMGAFGIIPAATNGRNDG